MMQLKKNIENCLLESKNNLDNVEDKLLDETKRILKNDLFTEKNILSNLGQYKHLEEVLDEEEIDRSHLFTLKQIQNTAIHYRLKFLDSKFYKDEVDYEAVIKIKELNQQQHKNLKHFKILSLPDAFANKQNKAGAALFVKTNHDNYYLIKQWGEQIPLKRKLFFWPLRNFETLAITIILFTIIEALILPTKLITLDAHANYWSGYRGGTFFHLLIFNSGFTAYFVLTFAKNFSKNLWNRKNDYD